MNDNLNYEKIVKKHIRGGLLLLRISLIAAYVIFAAIGFTLTFLLAKGSPALILLVGALDSVLILLTWKFTNVEFEYAVLSGYFFVSKIYGKSRRKELFEEDLSRAVMIAPYNEKYAKNANESKPDKIIEAISSQDAENVWFALFESTEKERVLIFFEADQRALKAFRHANPRCVARENLATVSADTKEIPTNSQSEE